MSHRLSPSLASALGAALVCGCIQPVVLGPEPVLGPGFGAGPGPAAAPASSGGAPAPASAPEPPGGAARGGALQRGQTLDGVLNRDEAHDYQIDLRAGETVHFQVTGVTEVGPNGERCNEWGWEWRSPDNGQRWHQGNPGPIENGDGVTAPRTFEVDRNTGVPIVDTMPGRWTFRVGVGADCHRIRYRLVAR